MKVKSVNVYTLVKTFQWEESYDLWLSYSSATAQYCPK